jgi:hypothetical protein
MLILPLTKKLCPVTKICIIHSFPSHTKIEGAKWKIAGSRRIYSPSIFAIVDATSSTLVKSIYY